MIAFFCPSRLMRIQNVGLEKRCYTLKVDTSRNNVIRGFLFNTQTFLKWSTVIPLYPKDDVISGRLLKTHILITLFTFDILILAQQHIQIRTVLLNTFKQVKK